MWVVSCSFFLLLLYSFHYYDRFHFNWHHLHYHTTTTVSKEFLSLGKIAVCRLWLMDRLIHRFFMINYIFYFEIPPFVKYNIKLMLKHFKMFKMCILISIWNAVVAVVASFFASFPKFFFFQSIRTHTKLLLLDMSGEICAIRLNVWIVIKSIYRISKIANSLRLLSYNEF